MDQRFVEDKFMGVSFVWSLRLCHCFRILLVVWKVLLVFWIVCCISVKGM